MSAHSANVDPDSANPFARRETVREPGIVGAVWWNESLVSSSSLRSRRDGIAILATVGLAALGIVAYTHFDLGFGDPKYAEEHHDSLSLQRTYGWNVGDAGSSLSVVSTDAPFDPAELKRLVDDVAPGNPAHVPYFQRTLLEVASAPVRSQLIEPESTRYRPYATLLTESPATSHLESRFRQGRDLGAAMAQQADARQIAHVIELRGEQAVAYAAGAAEVLDAVLLFDNWPHPSGVVPAHEALAAAIGYQSRFRETRARRASAPPLFVLDGARLGPYTDEADKFDNRYLAKLPDSQQMKQLGITRVRHLGYADDGQRAGWDLDPYYAAYLQAGIEVSVGSHNYPLDAGERYQPVVPPRPPPPSLGKVKVLVDPKSRKVRGLWAPAEIRSGSYNRVGSRWGGG